MPPCGTRYDENTMVTWWRSLYWSSSSAASRYLRSCGEGGFVRLPSPAPKPIFGADSRADSYRVYG